MARFSPRSLRIGSLATAAVVGAAAFTLLPNHSGPPRDAQHTAGHAQRASIVNHVPVAGSRPNVVMITTDDMAYEDLPYLPHVRKLLVDQGTNLTQGLAPTPICVPARASLLTGQYTHNHGAVTIDGDGGGFDSFDDNNTLPEWLEKAGYYTGFAGKYLNGYGIANPRYRPPGWDTWRASIDFSTYNFWGTKFFGPHGTVRPKGYSTDVISRYSDNIIRSAHRSGKPFFLWSSYVAPHHGGPFAPDDPQRRFPHQRKLWVGTTTPAPKYSNTFRELPLPDTPNMLRRTRHSVWRAPLPDTPTRRTILQTAWQQRLEALLSVDDAVAETMRTLRHTGELKDTIIVLASDNGFAVGQHNYAGKLFGWDQIDRIPMVVRGPGIPRGATDSVPVTNPDLAVSIAAAAGAQPTRTVDGIAMFDRLTTAPDARRIIPLEAYPVDGGLHRIYSGIRYAQWTYIHTDHHVDALFNRKVDPYENDNLIDDPKYAGMLKILRAWNRRYSNCAGSSCPQTLDPTP